MLDLFEELVEEQDKRRRDLEAYAGVQHRDRARTVQLAGSAEREDVREQRGAGGEAGEPDRDIASCAGRLAELQELVRTGRTVGPVASGRVDERETRSADDASLEAAAGRDRPVRDDPEAEQDSLRTSSRGARRPSSRVSRSNIPTVITAAKRMNSSPIVSTPR